MWGPAVSIGTSTVVEGNAGTTDAVFPVTLSGATTEPVTVSYATANGTATAGSDYTAAAGTLTIRGGADHGTMRWRSWATRLNEPDETFMVTLSSPVNATLGTATGPGTITNDDRGAGREHRRRDGGGGERRDDGRGLPGDAVGGDGAAGDGGLRDGGRDGDGGKRLHGGHRHADVRAGRHDPDHRGRGHWPTRSTSRPRRSW